MEIIYDARRREIKYKDVKPLQVKKIKTFEELQRLNSGEYVIKSHAGSLIVLKVKDKYKIEGSKIIFLQDEIDSIPVTEENFVKGGIFQIIK